jgi:hypothetical protein
VIRFSAGLVVVAIGVLIGGVATSKLSLVYGAIVVSAVALVTLAIGVALKRDELFGTGPELASAEAGADSGIPVGQAAGTGDVRGSDGHGREDQAKIRPTGPATAAFEAAAAASKSAAASNPAAAPTVAAPSVTTPPVTAPPVAAPSVVNPPSGQRQHAFSQASTRVDETVADWDTRPPQPPWSSGDQGRPIWTPREQAPTKPSSKEPQSGRTPASSAPERGWGSPADQPAPPSWFDRLNQPVAGPATAEPSEADQAKAEPAKTEPPKAESSKTVPPKAEPPKAEPPKAEPFKAFAAKTSAPDDDSSAATPSAAAASDVDTDDDDWPTRYSWLEDDETDQAAPPEAAKKPDATEDTDAADATDVTDAAETVAANTLSPDTVPAKTVTEKAKTAEPSPTDADSPDAATTDPHPRPDADHHPVTADDAIVTADSSAESAGTPAVAAAPEDTGTDEGPAPQATGAKLVTVIPGVPRYHDPDCILIRFMDDADIARKSIPEAQAANCTPCAACQPEG